MLYYSVSGGKAAWRVTGCWAECDGAGRPAGSPAEEGAQQVRRRDVRHTDGRRQERAHQVEPAAGQGVLSAASRTTRGHCLIPPCGFRAGINIRPV